MCGPWCQPDVWHWIKQLIRRTDWFWLTLSRCPVLGHMALLPVIQQNLMVGKHEKGDYSPSDGPEAKTEEARKGSEF